METFFSFYTLLITMRGEESIPFSISGTGERFSYSDWTVDQQGRLELFIGSTFEVLTGTGLQGIVIEESVSIVPTIDIICTNAVIEIAFEGALEVNDDLTQSNG